MRKSTKGMLAAAAAAALLMGGLGTSAAWDDNKTVGGTNVASGHLKLDVVTCDGWKLDGVSFDAVADLLAPGNLLTRHCRFEVNILGANVTATLAVTSPTFETANGLTNELTASATYEDAAGDPLNPVGATLSDGDVIDATISVAFPRESATNGSQDLAGSLQDVVVTVTQS